ncbi:hypothetical protein ACLOJK_006855 [Asimina triloba]
MGSRGEVSVTSARTGVALISESVNVVPVAHSPGSFSHINFPWPTVSDLLFSGGGIDDLNVDNVDRPLGLPGFPPDMLRDLLRLFVERVLAAREKLKDPHVVIMQIYLLTGSASKGTNLVSGRAVVPVAPVEGGAVEAIVPESDERSGDNSLTGQHIPIGDDHHVAVGGGSPRREGFSGSSSGPAPPLVINVEFIEPFRQLVSSCSVQLQRSLRSLVKKYLACTLSSFRDGFIKGIDALSDPDEAKVALIDALRADLAEVDVELPSLQKAMEERGAALLMDLGCLKKVEHDLLPTLSEVRRIKEAKVAPSILASISSALEMFRAASRDGFPFLRHDTVV